MKRPTRYEVTNQRTKQVVHTGRCVLTEDGDCVDEQPFEHPNGDLYRTAYLDYIDDPKYRPS